MSIATLPKSLRQIPLHRWVSFMNLYGPQLRQMHDVVMACEVGSERYNELAMEYEVTEALCHYHHFTGNEGSLFAVKPYLPEQVKGIIIEYNETTIGWKAELAGGNLTDDYKWNGWIYNIGSVSSSGRIFLPSNGGGAADAPPRMSYSDFKNYSVVAGVFADLMDEKYEAIYQLCAAFFRQSHELFSADLLTGIRAKEMEHLPLLYGLRVKYYCEQCVQSFNDANRAGIISERSTEDRTGVKKSVR